jgi:hypothetical protein
MEIDMVVNVGKVLSGEEGDSGWDYVTAEIAVVSDAVVSRGATLKGDFRERRCTLCVYVGYVRMLGSRL